MSESNICLSKLASFYVGGKSRHLSSSTYGDDELIVGSMYVQQLAPVNPSFPYPLVFVHGGMHSGVTWETTPDGREGWQTLFVRHGFETYVIDQSWRGRSAPDLSRFAPGLAPKGPEPEVSVAGAAIARFMARNGTRFPFDHVDTYSKQLCPDFGMVRARALGHPGISAPEALDPMVSLLERTGKAVLITHSQGGDLGWRLALACPEKVAAIVAVEPARTAPLLGQLDFPDIPILILWGDNIPDSAPILSKSDIDEAHAIAAKRPLVSVDVLPDSGITGNGHMMMMESNNIEIAERIMVWLNAAI